MFGQDVRVVLKHILTASATCINCLTGEDSEISQVNGTGNDGKNKDYFTIITEECSMGTSEFIVNGNLQMI